MFIYNDILEGSQSKWIFEVIFGLYSLNDNVITELGPWKVKYPTILPCFFFFPRTQLHSKEKTQ